MSSRLTAISARQGDALMALALSVVLLFELSLGSNITGPWWANYPFGLVVTGAVAFRRSWPVWALSAQLSAALISTACGGDLTENPFTPFIAVIITTYAVGCY